MQFFHLEQAQRDVPGTSSSKSAAVYKISSKSDDFSLIYGDITNLKFDVGATTPCRTPCAETFVCSEGTWQGQTQTA